MTHSAHIDRKLDRLLARLFVACLAILGIFAALSAYTCVRPAFTNVGDVHVNDPHAAVAAARLLIERQRRMPEKYREMIHRKNFRRRFGSPICGTQTFIRTTSISSWREIPIGVWERASGLLAISRIMIKRPSFRKSFSIATRMTLQ